VVLLAAVASLVSASVAPAVHPLRSGPPPGETRSGGPAQFLASVVKSSADDWPELHQTPLLTGYASNSPLSSRNASHLGVAWATDLYASALDSPVVAYDPVLGETLTYVGTEAGNVLAINLVNGQIVWGVWLGSPIRSSPLVADGSLFVGTFTTSTIFKLNATTGATECRLVSPDRLEATPTFATPPGGVPTLFFGALDTGPASAPFMAVDAANCSVEWKFTDYNHTAGSWDAASYAVSKSGVPLVLFGTDNPDSSVYALNALTGKEVWRFQAYSPPGSDYDVAAGAAISPPGKNGFPQGVAYVTSKSGRAYALDLNNGTLLWETNFDAIAGVTGMSRSTPALDGTNVIFGYSEGLVNLNATNGKVNWFYNDTTGTESIAAPAIAGGHGHGIVVTGDVGGDLDVLSVVGGAPLYSYPTGGYITGSPAVSGGNLVLASSDGFLYDFAVGGGNDATLPTTAVSYPAEGSTLANPNGDLTVAGNATAAKGVVAVEVSVQTDGSGGPWWDAATKSWAPGPAENAAKLASPGAASTAWSLSYPVPSAGGTYKVTAYAVSSSGQSALDAPVVSFVVRYSTAGPHFEVTPNYVGPGANVTVVGGGFGRNVNVTVSLYGIVVATIKSAANGSLPSTRIAISPKAAFGLTALSAVAKSTGKSSTAALTVGNSWDQQGYDPGHSGWEPDDSTLADLIFPGGNNWVDVAWHFDAGAPLDASPAVVDGVAYVGDTAGHLYALDFQNGGLLWSFTVVSGAAIDGSPAVDPGLALVFFGADDGSLRAVHVANGSFGWSAKVGGQLAAPVVSGGVVYVTSSTGKVEALREATGAMVWSRTLGSSVTSAAALSAAAGLLVVGESNGDVVAVSAATGATQWTYATGGGVTASAVVYAETVYVGSSDHKVYALNLQTGGVRWTFTTGGAVDDTGALVIAASGAPTSIVIGSNDGYVYVLSASTGKLVFKLGMGSPIVGVSVTKNAAIFETASGIVSATRTNDAIDGWRYVTSGTLATAPAIVDGTIYVAAGDGNLYAFDANGQPPD
jgi:outer membrane protein assembly factor BamB